MSTVDIKLAERIFDKWKTHLKGLEPYEKKMEFAGSIFDQLYAEFFTKKMQVDIVYPFVKEAIKSYSPCREKMEAIYKSLKASGTMKKSRDEFCKQWLDRIETVAYKHFYQWYPDSDVEEVNKAIAEKNRRQPEKIGSSKEDDDPDSEKPSNKAITKAQRELAEYAEEWPEIPADIVEAMKAKRLGLK